MKRIMMAVLAGAVLSAGATFALASHEEAIPDECANAHDGTDISRDTLLKYTPGWVTVDLVLHGASCLAADYSVMVFDENPQGGTPVILDAITFPGDGSSSAFTIQRPVADSDPGAEQRVCINITVSTTQHVESGSTGSGSSHPGGNGNAPPMQNTSTDTNSVDTETVVDWGAELLDTGEAVTCIPVGLSAGSGSRGMN